MAVKVTTAPDEEAITLEVAQQHVKADADDDNDALLMRAIVAARQRAEHELGRPLLPQTCEKRFDRLERKLYLWEDVTEILAVSYVDNTGATVELDPFGFYLTGGRTANVVGSLPPVREVIVSFKCGAFDPASVPASIIDWMLLQVGAIHENRSSVESTQTYELPGPFVDGLIDRYRYYTV